MNLKQTALALVSAGLLSVTLSGTAQADVMASSVVNITNLQFLNADNSQVAFSQFTAFTFTSSAGYAGSIGSSSFSGSSATQPIDFAANCVGSGCGSVLPLITENVFPKLNTPTLGNYAAADQFETGSPVSGVTGFPSGPITASVANGSYAGLTSGSLFASADSNNNINSSFLFTLAGAGAFKVSFLADAFLLAFITGDEDFPGFATASYQVDFTLSDVATGGTIFTYSPDLFANGTKTVSRNAPSLTGLDSRIELDTANTGPAGTPDPFVSALTPLLDAGKEYQLSARVQTNADAQRVPEPASLALIGMGLLGMGLARLRKAA